MFFKKSPTIKYLLALFLFTSAILFIVVFRFSKETVIPNDNNTPVVVDPSDIANWLVYEDLKYGYSIKYPPDWHIIEGEVGQWWCDVDDDKPCGSDYYIYLATPKGSAPIKVQVTIDNDGLPLEEDLKKRGWEVEEDCNLIVINNLEGLDCRHTILFGYKDIIYWISWADTYSFINEDLLEDLKTVVPKTQATYQVVEGFLGWPKTKEIIERVLWRIASTFRILKD